MRSDRAWEVLDLYSLPSPTSARHLRCISHEDRHQDGSANMAHEGQGAKGR